MFEGKLVAVRHETLVITGPLARDNCPTSAPVPTLPDLKLFLGGGKTFGQASINTSDLVRTPSFP